MQFRVLISFFFAYIAAVQAAPVQLPAGGAVDVPSVPTVPGVPAVAPVARDLPAVDSISSTPDVDGAIDGVKYVQPQVPEVGQTLPALPVTPRDLPSQVDTIVVGLPFGGPIIVPVKRQNLAVNSGPTTDSLPNLAEAVGGRPSVDGTLPGVGKRFVIFEDTLSDIAGLLPADTPEAALPGQLPSTPAIPPMGKIVRRQVAVPQPEAPTVEDVPADFASPTTPSLPAKVVLRDVEDGLSIFDETLSGVVAGEVRQAELPELDSQDLPATPSTFDSVTGLVSRQVDVPDIDVTRAAVQDVDGLPLDSAVPSDA